MRTIFRSIIFSAIALYISSQLFPSGLKISGGISTIAEGGLIFGLMTLILRPILQIISFPINLITLGLFSFLINAGLLYAMTRFVPKISVHAFTISKLYYYHITIPKIHLNIY